MKLYFQYDLSFQKNRNAFTIDLEFFNGVIMPQLSKSSVFRATKKMKMQKIITSPLILLTFVLLSSCKETVNFEEQIQNEITLIEENLLPPVIIKDSLVNFALRDRLKEYNVKGISIALIEGGEIKWAKGYGVANETDSISKHTLFQAGSISKPITALAALKLVSEGKLDLDTDIRQYLKSWELPKNDYDRVNKVTLRKLLSHTAGINVSGFTGYVKSENKPTLNDILNGEAKNDAIKLDTIPGVRWSYSGGGYVIVEKIIEDVTEEPFFDYLKKEILIPLGMENTKYLIPSKGSKSHISSGFVNGDIIEDGSLVYYQPSAAGLWSTPSDLARFCIAIQDAISGKRTGIISQELAKEMIEKNINNWGLGPQLNYESDSLIFQHNGNTKGFTASIKAFAYKGKGLVIMTNSDMEQKLIPEIVRTVAYHYDWRVETPLSITPIKLNEDLMNTFLGEYKYEKEIPEVGEYKIAIERRENDLYFNDGSLSAKLLVVNNKKLVMYKNGRQFLFEKKNDKVLSFLLDEKFKFIKK